MEKWKLKLAREQWLKNSDPKAFAILKAEGLTRLRRAPKHQNDASKNAPNPQKYRMAS